MFSLSFSRFMKFSLGHIGLELDLNQEQNLLLTQSLSWP
ncbi:hypothetical protein CWATWH0005_3789 [Crocosphaera watsonii WH 0005]|uniref:Uncharacterized protein n=1 Tax=Crocosphaera watsonii WH 0005 TaxID=423472 RepID=T2IWD4_CROWT|nr:hypothetical protein CWATWH0005_3789 [Crocosphaera watsonii WH 0005]